MSYQSIWYLTDLPESVVDIIEKDLSEKFDDKIADSRLNGDVINKEKRNSKNAWIPTTHWVGGFVWHYIQRANRENFLYDLCCLDRETIQYTRYSEGEFYGWHTDSSIADQYKPISVGGNKGDQINQNTLIQDHLSEKTEMIRKLSFVLQLSHEDDYEGGNLQLLDEAGRSYFAPRKRGTMILFDSRTQHRVLKVTKGVRKSLVGWTCGPRWK